jgi:hypothetical protein
MVFNKTIDFLNTGDSRKTLLTKFGQEISRIIVYNLLAFPILLYESEIWALTKKKRIEFICINRD